MNIRPGGKLYMIPVPIAEDALPTLSLEIGVHTHRILHYFVENLRSARRFLRAQHRELNLDALSFSEMDKHTGPDLVLLRKWLKEGHEVGVLSEAGCPGIADPGAELAATAQAMGIPVIPLTGPCSIILALMASGLNGQRFAFTGYLPVKEPARSQRIKELEALSVKEQQTQVMIETPYRNQLLVNDLLKNCQPRTRLCIARDISGPASDIRTKQVGEWKQAIPEMGKVPVVFLLLG